MDCWIGKIHDLKNSIFIFNSNLRKVWFDFIFLMCVYSILCTYNFRLVLIDYSDYLIFVFSSFMKLLCYTFFFWATKYFVYGPFVWHVCKLFMCDIKPNGKTNIFSLHLELKINLCFYFIDFLVFILIIFLFCVCLMCWIIK